MESLSTVAAKQWRRLSRRPTLPGWWPLFSVLLVVVGMGYLFVSLVSSSPTPRATHDHSLGNQTLGGQAASIGTFQGSAPVTTAPSPSHGSAAGSTTGNQAVQVPSANTTGPATMRVPSGALRVADKAALAYYTTNFSGVPLAAGAQRPRVSVAFPNATIVSSEALGGGGSQYVFQITVDPEPGSPNDPGDHYLDITVVDQGGQWAFSGGS